MYKELSKIFKICRFYISPVPTYPGGIWAYLFCSDYYEPLKSKIKRIPRRLKFYSRKVHRAIFEIANFLK
jgi:spermidine synthase